MTKQNLWQATASRKFRDPTQFGNNLHENADKFIQKTTTGFPRTKCQCSQKEQRVFLTESRRLLVLTISQIGRYFQHGNAWV